MSKQEVIEHIKANLHKFKFKLDGRAKFEDIDMLQVVHNLRYMYWAEYARTELLREVLFPAAEKDYLFKFPLLIVKNEVNYFGFLQFNDEYSVYTRVSELGKSSMKMENLITRKDGEPILHCETTFVHVDSKYSQAKEIEPEIRKKIEAIM